MPERTLVLVHATPPPVPGGTNTVLARLFGAPARWRLEVFTDVAHRRTVRRGGDRLLPGRYRYFPRLGALLPTLRSLVDALDVPLAVAAGARVRLGLGSSAAGVVSVADNGFSPIAGAFAALLLRCPHVVMVFDLWEENAYSAASRRLARLVEGPILRSAGAVVVFCPQAAHHLHHKHGVECWAIDTPIDVGPSGPGASLPDRRPLEILVAGAIYWAQEDAVRRLLRAAAGVDAVTVTIVGDEPSLRARGFAADAYEPPLPGAEFHDRLRRADILFIGLSFASPHPEVVLTATPARLPECMAAGRPLLIHAPAASHVATYGRDEDLGVVVDQPSEEALERGIRALLDDPDGAAARSRRAARLARERHDAAAVREAFGRILDGLLAGNQV
ncbi:MAG: glycosyltransferase [Actinomycetota bacterium]|nr:glycosyltransferase [Actinomycetota bacterium]